MVGYAALDVGGLLLEDARKPLARDLQPGMKAEAPPYDPPPGCPQRVWSVGEFIPHTCLGHHVINPLGQPPTGLEPVRQPSNPLHYQRWIRVRSDALLISGERAGSARIRAVVRNRFVSTGPEPAFEPQPDVMDYRRTPREYVVGTALDLFGGPLIFALVLPLIWMFGAYREGEPPMRSWRELLAS